MKWRSVWTAMLVAGVLMGGGCKNNNLFGDLHKEGSGDAASLVSDGESALARGNYAAAQGYFERALAQEPGNSKALYGAAAAAMGLGGLDFGQLIANLTQGNSGSTAPSFRGVIQQASLGIPAPSSPPEDSLLYMIDPSRLDEALKVVIRSLERIHMGLGDGRIAPEEPSLLINLGLARLLKGVTGPLRNGILDIRENVGNYQVELLSFTAPEDCGVAVNAIYNVAWGFNNLADAALKLNLVSGSTIADIKEDVEGLYTDFQAKITGCTTPGSIDGAGKPTSPDDRLNP